METRRKFVKSAAAGIAALPLAALNSPPATGKTRMLGIQINSVSFLDEGVERVLDIVQERAAVNTVFLATFANGSGLIGRQLPGHPFPDHGRHEYDKDLRGGNFARVHPEYYRNTILDVRATRAPDHGDFDILETVLPSAKKRGLKTICFLSDDWWWNTNKIGNLEKLEEVDVDGKRTRNLCRNNPDHVNFLLGLVEDQGRSYPVDGLMWGSEQQGALNWAIQGRTERMCCFCPHCEKKGRERGINVDRARQGFRELRAFVQAGGSRPVDGYFVQFWRILLRYPEVLAWETLWTDSLRDLYKTLYRKAKSIRPDLLMGWHLWHTNSFSPFYRAEQDIRELSGYSDYLKVVMYNNCGGPRITGHVDAVQKTIFADFSKDETLRLLYRMLNYEEPGYEEVAKRGLSEDYVYREAKRAMEPATGTRTLIWAGIDVDIPAGKETSRSTPETTKSAVKAAFRAGADGIILSRKYSEMKLENLSGVGAAVRELG